MRQTGPPSSWIPLHTAEKKVTAPGKSNKLCATVADLAFINPQSFKSYAVAKEARTRSGILHAIGHGGCVSYHSFKVLLHGGVVSVINGRRSLHFSSKRTIVHFHSKLRNCSDKDERRNAELLLCTTNVSGSTQTTKRTMFLFSSSSRCVRVVHPEQAAKCQGNAGLSMQPTFLCQF